MQTTDLKGVIAFVGSVRSLARLEVFHGNPKSLIVLDPLTWCNRSKSVTTHVVIASWVTVKLVFIKSRITLFSSWRQLKLYHKTKEPIKQFPALTYLSPMQTSFFFSVNLRVKPYRQINSPPFDIPCTFEFIHSAFHPSIGAIRYVRPLVKPRLCAFCRQFYRFFSSVVARCWQTRDQISKFSWLKSCLLFSWLIPFPLKWWLRYDGKTCAFANCLYHQATE